MEWVHSWSQMKKKVVDTLYKTFLRDYDQNNSSMPKMREMQPQSKLRGDVVQYLEMNNSAKPALQVQSCSKDFC